MEAAESVSETKTNNTTKKEKYIWSSTERYDVLCSVLFCLVCFLGCLLLIGERTEAIFVAY